MRLTLFTRWLARQLRMLFAGSTPYASHQAFEVPVLIVNYFPVKNGRIDRDATGDVDAPLEDIRRHTIKATAKVIQTLETGSTYHGYKDPEAIPALRYRVLDTVEFLEPMPTYDKPGHNEPMADYNAIMERIDIRHWVEERGVKEVWMWGYHGGVIKIWESNMSGPHGDVSNSDCDTGDLPVLSKTYTVYNYNYGRGASECIENHIHQIEAVLKFVDYNLFWKKYVGEPGEGRCGWAHYPPNGVRDYDWANETFVWTDIEDWRPDGGGEKVHVNCTRWNCDSLTWFTYWMQNLPGINNGIEYRGRPLTNWWAFLGDWDGVMEANLRLFD